MPSTVTAGVSPNKISGAPFLMLGLCYAICNGTPSPPTYPAAPSPEPSIPGSGGVLTYTGQLTGPADYALSNPMAARRNIQLISRPAAQAVNDTQRFHIAGDCRRLSMRSRFITAGRREWSQPVVAAALIAAAFPRHWRVTVNDNIEYTTNAGLVSSSGTPFNEPGFESALFRQPGGDRRQQPHRARHVRIDERGDRSYLWQHGQK